jgi:hypothetical protein
MAERQTHDVSVAALDSRHGTKRGVLDGVGGGFVQRIASGNIGGDFRIGIVAHQYAGGDGDSEVRSWLHPHQDQASPDAMPSMAQGGQHGRGFSRVAWLAQDAISQGHDGIGGDNRPVRMSGGTVSSTSLAMTVNGAPRSDSNSRRRGEAEARIKSVENGLSKSNHPG